MGNELATGYVSIVAETRGIGKALTAEFGRAQSSASKAGRGIGAAISKGVASAKPGNLEHFEKAFADAEKRREAVVKRTSATVEDARSREEIATAKLKEAEARYAADSSKVLTAKRNLTRASEQLKLAEERAALEVKNADKQVDDAKASLDEAAKASEGFGRKLGRAFRDIGRGDFSGATGKLKGLFGRMSAGGRKAGEETGEQFSKGMSDRISSGSKGIGGVFKGMLGANLVTGAISKATSGLGSYLSAAAQASDATDKFKSTLDFAGKGAAEIEKLTRSAQKYADVTVYDLSDIQSITAQLAANGVKGFDKLAEAAGNLNAVAGGNAETFKSVGMVMTQTAGAGKLTGENWRQLSDAIPGASGKIKDALQQAGAYTGDFATAMSKGEITAEEFNAAIMSLGFEDAAVKAAQSTSTFEGAWGNFQAAIEGGLAKILGVLKPFATGALNTITAVIEPVFAGLASMLERSIGAISGVLGKVEGPLASLKGAIGRGFTAAWEGAKEAVGGFVDGFGGLDAVLESVRGMLPLVTGPLGIIKDALLDVFAGESFDTSGLRAAGEEVGAFLRPLVDVAAQLAGMISGALGQAIAQIVPIVSSLVSSVAPLVSQLVQQLAPIIVSLVQSLLPPFQRILAAVVDVFGRVAAAVVPLVETLIEQLVPVIVSIAEQAAPLFEKAFQLVASVLEALTPVIDVVAQTLTGVLGAAVEWLAPVVEQAFATISTVISVAMDVIRGVIDAVTAVIRGDWSEAWDAIQGVAQRVWDTIKGYIGDKIEAVRRSISDVTGRIKSAWDGFWGGMRSAGETAWNWISGTAVRVFNGMVEPIKTAFSNIKSGVETIWNDIKKVVAKPINVVIGFINDGIIGAYNWVANKLSMKPLGRIQPLPGYARGGILPGQSSWWQGDDQLIMARRGEGITVSEALRDPYERKRLLALNESARKGISPERFRQMFDAHPQGFAKGGLVSYRGKTFSAVFAAALKAAEQAAGHTFNITQGGFRPRTSYSGTSHQGDAVDIARPYSVRTVAALRSSGIAAWDRAGKGNWIDHVHGVPLPGFGSPAGSAVWQARDYLRGGDGLGGRDNGPRGGKLTEGLKALIDAIKAGFNSVWDWFKGKFDELMGPLKNLALPGGNMISDLAKGVAEHLKTSLWDWAKSKLGFAGGTPSAPSGWAWVGERGPELVRFRGGERVLTHQESVRAVGSGQVTQYVTLQLPEWVRDVSDMVAFLRSPQFAAHMAGGVS